MQQLVHIFQIQLLDVRERFDFLCHQFDLRVGEFETELFRAVFDGVPAREFVRDGNVARESEILRVENFVRFGFVQNRFRMNARLVRERGDTRNVIIERHRDADNFRDELVHFAKFFQFVFFLCRRFVVRVHARDESAEWCDAVALADAENTRINMRCARVERAE